MLGYTNDAVFNAAFDRLLELVPPGTGNAGKWNEYVVFRSELERRLRRLGFLPPHPAEVEEREPA